MPLSQNPIVEWPADLYPLLQNLQITPHAEGPRCGQTDIDVDAETLFLLNDFEARVRHRRVRLRSATSSECLVGEMNVLVGLGRSADPARHVGKVRISFHDIQDDSCVDPIPHK
jgi:hypothetical protein